MPESREEGDEEGSQAEAASEKQPNQATAVATNHTTDDVAVPRKRTWTQTNTQD